MALSGEWRKTQYDLTSNAQPDPANCTGLRFNCSGSTLQYISNVVADQSGVSQTVTEGAGEVSVPLLRDVPLAQSLILNGAARYTYYDTSGYATTWKLGLDWHLNDDITIRSTRSRDIRAPNLTDLFGSPLTNPAGVTDLHTGIVGQAPFITSSNPNLKPEVGNTTTAGIVYRPSFLPGASIAVDYYQINITDAIANVQGQNNTVQQICEDSNGSSPYCALIQRPLPFSNKTPANFVTAFFSSPQNVNAQRVHGIDTEVNYNTELFGNRLSLRYLMVYQPSNKTINTLLGGRVDNSADTATQPEFSSTAFASYSINKYTIDVQQRWYTGGAWNANRTLKFIPSEIKGNAYTNLTVSREIRDRSTAYVTIQNLFNRQPNAYGNIGGSSGVPGLFGGFVPGVDNQMGRYYTVGVRLRY
jgi:outer membrane receptor protein involved in Fe transport